MASIHPAIYKLASPNKVAPIKGHDGYYATSNGRIISTRMKNGKGCCQNNPRFVMGSPDKDGYLKVTMDGVYERIHELIATAFLGEKTMPNLQVRHINGINSDNRIENLVWGTCLENQRDRYTHGTVSRGNLSGKHILTEDEVREIKKALITPYRGIQAELSRRYNVDNATINHIARSRSWSWLNE